jgi:23S rRNA (uracil1939-C5)-methyltransferase
MSPSLLTLRIERLVEGGQGMGRADDGRVCFAWNTLPGELVRVRVTKSKKTHVEGVAEEVLEASPHRVVPQEAVWLSTSPWQHMDFAVEGRAKAELAKETFRRVGGFEAPLGEEAVSDGVAFGYRNKMEWSFAFGADGNLSLAVVERGGRDRLPVPGSALAQEVLNTVSLAYVKWANEKRLPLRSLKSLIVRTSTSGKALTGLFIKDRLSLVSPTVPDVVGASVFYSTHKSPASVVTDVLDEQGSERLETTIGGRTFVHGLFSFLQVNIPLYERALAAMKVWNKPELPLVDLYSGIGSIGLSIAPQGQSLTLVEIDAQAAACAQKNAERLHPGARVVCAPSEAALQEIVAQAVVIVDPPRAGLHPHVLKRLLTERPARILYLACDAATQARDLAALREAYTISHMELFNFFPRTPHVECLAVLDRS